MARSMADLIRDARSELGRAGARALNASRTPQERSEAARRAVTARWTKYRLAKQEDDNGDANRTLGEGQGAPANGDVVEDDQ